MTGFSGNVVNYVEVEVPVDYDSVSDANVVSLWACSVCASSVINMDTHSKWHAGEW